MQAQTHSEQLGITTPAMARVTGRTRELNGPRGFLMTARTLAMAIVLAVLHFIVSHSGLKTAAAQPGPPPLQYSVTDLGPLTGDSWTLAYGLNEYGQVVGRSSRTGPQGEESQPFLWQPDSPNSSTGTMYGLGTFGGSIGNAFAINDRGQASGEATDASGIHKLFFWNPTGANLPTGSMHDLGVPHNESVQTGINEAGLVCGTRQGPEPILWTPSTLFPAFGSTPTGTVSVLPHPAYGKAFAINESDWMTGFAGGNQGTYHAARWVPDGNGGYLFEDIGDLGAQYQGSATASSINDAGIVTGHYKGTDPADQHRAMLWDPQGNVCTIHDGSAILSRGLGINSSGATVGYYVPVPNQSRAFLYEGGMGCDMSQLYDLNLGIDSGSGWILGEAREINDAGSCSCCS